MLESAILLDRCYFTLTLDKLDALRGSCFGCQSDPKLHQPILTSPSDPKLYQFAIFVAILWLFSRFFHLKLPPIRWQRWHFFDSFGALTVGKICGSDGGGSRSEPLEKILKIPEFLKFCEIGPKLHKPARSAWDLMRLRNSSLQFYKHHALRADWYGLGSEKSWKYPWQMHLRVV